MQYNGYEKEDAVLSARLTDKMRQCEDQYMMTHSVFLDMRQRTLAQSVLSKQQGVRWGFYGGYEDAERCVAVFVPDYLDVTGSMDDYFKAHPEDDPLRVVRAKTLGGAGRLTHRDYLGSLLGLGLKREVVGDILVREDGADIVVDCDIADFLMLHYGKAGRVSLSLSLVSAAEIIIPQGRIEEREDTVASLRLDNVVASVFSMSRGSASEAVRSGLVFVNGLQLQKPDSTVREGDKLVLRGKGKAVLKTVGGRTRKDRIVICYQRFL